MRASHAQSPIRAHMIRVNTTFRPIARGTRGATVASFRTRRSRDMRNQFGMCGLIVLTVLPANGAEPLTLEVTPMQSFAPTTLRVRARIEPSAANRTLTIIADGPEFYRSSEVQLDGDQLLTITVSPQVALAPADVFIYVRITPQADNRLLRVTAESSEFLRTSEVQLNGEDSARATTFDFRALPEGSYELKATLVGSNDRTIAVSQCAFLVM
jgi:hypothetical protein